MKKCIKCGREKPVNEFTRNRKNEDGRRGSCKICDRNRYNPVSHNFEIPLWKPPWENYNASK